MSYKHIIPEQQNELSALLRAEIKKKDIAEQLSKDRTTIWRELKRNGYGKNYDARVAKRKTKERRISANQRFRKLENNKWLRKYVVEKLKLCWSPEQISGRIRIDYPNNKKRQIGKDSIYDFVYTNRPDLVKYLRCTKGKFRRRKGTKIREKQRREKEKNRIDKRPEIVERRERIGDWEGDTIVGGEKTTAILTHVERKSGYLIADKLERAYAEDTRKIAVNRFNNLPKRKRYTITYDNGSEFADYEIIEKQTGVEIYFAYPYHSWERGTNENTNGLLRQFFPKKSPFAIIMQEDIEKAASLINNRPRKRLNYFTPTEVFYEKTKCCTLD